MSPKLETKSEKQEEKVIPSEREGDHTQSVEAKTIPEGSTSVQAETNGKSKELNGGKKSSKVKCSHKHGKNKSKKSKKLPATDSSDSSDESEHELESSSNSDSESSESDSAVAVKGKRSSKKRQASQKSKKSKAKAKSKKTKSIKEQSDISASDSEEDLGDLKHGASKRNQKDIIAELQREVQRLKQQQTPNLGLGAGGNSFGGLSYGGMPQSLLPPPSFNPFTQSYNQFPPPLNNRRPGLPGRRTRRDSFSDDSADGDDLGRDNLLLSRSKRQDRNKAKPPQRMEYKRVDQVWDSQIHNYKLQDTAETSIDSRYDEFLFHVRRTFDWEGKYKATIVDIKSKQLREALQDVMGNLKSVSLVEDTPKLDPNLLFLYLEDLREHMNNLKELEPDGKSKKERKKVQKWINEKRRHLKVLIKYLDKDYAHVKKSLYPLLENGLITFDLCWALWKPNTLAYTTTYGCVDEPRAFNVELAERHFSIVKGEFYYIEGKYFEYDGKQFGFGAMSEEIAEFRGSKKITSLPIYPLKYHKNEAAVRELLIARGKKFVSLSGVHYKAHNGMAYSKKKKSVIKVNINGRVMVDPAIHRRTLPNYPVSLVRPKDHDILSDDSDSDMEGCCECANDSDEGGDHGSGGQEPEDDVKYVTKVLRDKNGKPRMVRIPKDKLDDDQTPEKLDKVDSKDEGGDQSNEKSDEDKTSEIDDTDPKTPPEFTDEEYLIASPVVLGFALGEKLWLEFTVSGVSDIKWNEGAYESLVLEPKTKDIVKALVESHKYHAAQSIDDVIQGKGKGLVAVLHGPPGTGKTLTAEGISELLKCPLYMVSAGDLGTDSRYLEGELQKILDICHAWGAILLLDEADVFLEKRNMQDIHRNALVSIFLRQLEYFQGILFLTTNRVETFDDAFQSRIHIGLRYDDLDQKAKRSIFKMFIQRVYDQNSNAPTVTASTTISIPPAAVSTTPTIDTSPSLVVTPATTKSTPSKASSTSDSSESSSKTTIPFTEEDYTTLAKHDLNGRQIKNTVRTAQALAVNKGEQLAMKHIRQAIETTMKFTRDWKGGSGYQDAMRSYF